MKFDDFLKKKGRRGETRIRVRLQDLGKRSSVNRQMWFNLFAETRLANSDWNFLFTALDRARPGTKATAQAICTFCRGGRTLSGGRVKIGANVTLGKVVSQEKYLAMLSRLDAGRRFPDMDLLRTHLRLHMKVSPSTSPEDWKKLPLGNKIMWSTFDLVNEGHPFSYPLPPLNVIVCMLGLELDASPMLIFEYRLPDNVNTYIPTFCDVYGGKLWHRYFRPALPGETYGHTMPTDTCPDQKGRPEVVHQVIEMRNLVKPIRYGV